MGANYDKFKNKMAQDNKPLPAGLEWDNMKDGIFQKMQALEPTPQQQPSIFSLRNALLAISVIVIILLLKSNCNSNEEAIITQSNENAKIQTFETTQSISQANGSTETHVPTPGWLKNDQDFIEEKSIHRTRRQLLSEQPISFISRHAARNNAINALVDSVEIDKKEVPFYEEKTSLTSQQSNNIGNSNKGLDSTLTDIGRPLGSALFQNESTLQAIASLPTDLKPLKTIPYLEVPNEIGIGTPKERSTVSDRLYLSGGISIWNFGYNSSKPERSSYERPLASFSSQFDYVHALPNNYTLWTGLYYQQLNSAFAYQGNISDYVIILKDTIVSYSNNIVSGHGNAIIGDVRLEVNAQRIVHHFNTTRLFQVPLAFGKVWTTKKWQHDLMLGGTVNFFTNNQGKTVFNNDILAYNGKSTTFLSNQWKFNALIGGRLTYQLSEQFGLSAGVQLQKSLSNWGNEASGVMRPLLFNSTIGVMYRLP